MYCTKCGAKILNNANFCTRCGCWVAVPLTPQMPQQQANLQEDLSEPQPRPTYSREGIRSLQQPSQPQTYQNLQQPAQPKTYQNLQQPAQPPTYQNLQQPAQQQTYQNPLQTYQNNAQKMTASPYVQEAGTAAPPAAPQNLHSPGAAFSVPETSQSASAPFLKWLLAAAAVLAAVLFVLSRCYLYSLAAVAAAALALMCALGQSYDEYGMLGPIAVYTARYMIIIARHFLDGWEFSIGWYILEWASVIGMLVIYLILMNSRREGRNGLRFVIILLAGCLEIYSAYYLIQNLRYGSSGGRHYSIANMLFLGVYIAVLLIGESGVEKMDAAVPAPAVGSTSMPFGDSSSPAAARSAPASAMPAPAASSTPVSSGSISSLAAASPAPAASRTASLSVMSAPAASRTAPLSAAPEPEANSASMPLGGTSSPAAASTAPSSAMPKPAAQSMDVLIGRYPCNARGDEVAFYEKHIEFRGQSIAYADIESISENAQTTRTRALLVYTSHFSANFGFVLKNGTKTHFTVGGTSVYGMGNKNAAKEMWPPISNAFRNVVAKEMAERLIAEIRQGGTVTAGTLSISQSGFHYKKLFKEEQFCPAAEFGSCNYNGRASVVMNRNGEKLISVDRTAANGLLLPFILNAVYEK